MSQEPKKPRKSSKSQAPKPEDQGKPKKPRAKKKKVEEPIKQEEQVVQEPVQPVIPVEPIQVVEEPAQSFEPQPVEEPKEIELPAIAQEVQKNIEKGKVIYKKFDIKTIAIVFLLAIILIMSMFNGCGSSNKDKGDIIKIDGKKYEVIKHEIDTFNQEVVKTVTKPGKDIYHDTTIYVPVPQEVDTEKILKDYYAKKVKKDTLYLPDSLGLVSVTDTLYKNDILARTWNASVIKQLVVDRMIVKEQAKNQIYIGMVLGVDRIKILDYVGPSIIVKTKKDRLYSAGFGYSHDGAVSVQGGVYWKIRLKK